MSLSYALGDDADLRRRLMVKIGVPRTARELAPITASANNHTAETPDADVLQRLTSDIYRVAQGDSAAKAPSVKGETGAL